MVKRVLLGLGTLIGIVVIGVAVWVWTGPGAFVRSGGAHLPAPSGEYGVGRVRMGLLDESRDEVLTDDPNDKREFVLNIYYPANVPADAEPVRYTEARGLTIVDGVPAFLISPVTPNTVADAPAVEGPFAVIVFSAGFGGGSYYATWIEEMVSQGYVVLAPEITYNFSAVYFPDGRVIKANDQGQWDGEYDIEEQRLVVSDVWVGDISFALDTAESLNETHPILAGTMDLSRVGAVGHSFGGQSSVAAAYHDDRILAAVNFDGRMVDDDLLANGLDKPVMLVYDDFEPPYDYIADFEDVTLESWWAEFQIGNYPTVLQNGSGPLHVVQVEGAEHESFYTDLPFLAPMFPGVITEDMIGTLEAESNLRAVTGVTLAFLDAYLNGGMTTDEALADFPNVHAGIDVTGWGLSE